MRLIFAFLFIILSSNNFAQGSLYNQKIEEAISIYDELIAYQSDLEDDYYDYIDEYAVFDMEDFRDQAFILLDDVLKGGSFEQKKAARFFKFFFNIEIADAYFEIDENYDAYSLLNSMASEIEYFSLQESFPIAYTLSDGDYEVTYDIFLPNLSNYYNNLSWVCLNLSKNSESIEWARKSISLENADEWNKFLSSNQLLIAKKNLGQLDEETINTALLFIQFVNGFNQDTRSKISSNGINDEGYAAQELILAIQKNPVLAKNGQVSMKAAKLLKSIGNKLHAVNCYAQMIVDGSENIEFLDEALAYFKLFAQESNASSSGSIWSSAYGGDLKRIAAQGADRLEQLLNKKIDCEKWLSLATYYDYLDNSGKATSARSNYKACIKAFEKNHKENHSNGNDQLGIYAGLFPLPMLWGNLGGIVQVNMNKIGFGLAYTHVDHDRDYQSDFYNPITGHTDVYDLYGNTLDREKVYWDGSRLNGLVKFFVDEDDDYRVYVSLNVGRVKKTYEPFGTYITEINTNWTVYSGKIAPTEVKYTFYIGGGAETNLSKHWIMDFGVGIGAAKAKLDLDNIYFNDPKYYIASNLIQSAAAKTMGMSAYLNISIGYKFF